MVRPSRRLNHSSILTKLALASLIALSIGGCARSVRSIDAARDSFAVGDLPTAKQTLQEITERGGRNGEAAALDLAMVELAAGETNSAEKRLRLLRDQFDAQAKVAPLREAASVVTDDTVRQFRPAGYEEVMIRTMLSLCSLASDKVDAESYALQAMMKQSELAREAEEQGILNVSDVFQPIAFAPYLRGMLREVTHHDYDDAARAYQLVSAVRPEFAPATADIARATGGTHSAPGHGVLYVIACVGRGPVLQETDAETTSTALSIASSVLNAETNETEDDESAVVLPNIASVKVPQVVVPACDIAAVGIRIGGQLYGATQTLTDVGQLASTQQQAEMPWTIARAVVRRATKEAAVAKVGDSMGLEGTAGSLFHFAAASAWSGVEHADTRCWGLLPREIQVFRAELPTGMHGIQLQPLGYGGDTLTQGSNQTVEIRAGDNTYLIVMAPDRAIYVVP